MTDTSSITDMIRYIDKTDIKNADTLRYRWYRCRRCIATVSIYRPISTVLCRLYRRSWWWLETRWYFVSAPWKDLTCSVHSVQYAALPSMSTHIHILCLRGVTFILNMGVWFHLSLVPSLPLPSPPPSPFKMRNSIDVGELSWLWGNTFLPENICMKN